MGWMNDVFGGGYSNPADAAQPYLDKIPGYVDQYEQPYIDTGLQAGNIAQQQYALMASNPSGYYNSLYGGYNTSPEAQYQSDQMSKAQSNSAAAGGFSGTEYDYDQQMAAQNAISQEDWEKYLNDVLGIQTTGLGGEQKMYQTGYNASQNALQGDIGYANASAANQFGGTQASNAMSSGMLGMLGQSAGLGAGMYALGGGFSGASAALPPVEDAIAVAL